ncbi:hypothetical protein MSG28_006667 [Choristoneura fumiferana]|uniref:Uncharacterized protein n=1 Tax=Choristoneura fumiferana TaxID=7141 RepID=A0ACC0JKR3_CHOFU|nr:hypothetical protein MSG28_006667 [Choristoneura fumiferana]
MTSNVPNDVFGRPFPAASPTRLSELPRPRSPDALTSRLQEAPSASAVLAAVQAALPAATAQHMLQALRSLFALHRAGKFDKDTDELIKDPAFNVLCQNFKKHARALDVNEAIEATKVLSYLRVPVDSLVVQTMLQLVRYNINELNIRQIMFLDFILNRYDTKNHLVDALKLALPLAFQIHLPMEMDNEDLPLLRDMLFYCCAHSLPDRCINNVVTGVLLHDQSIDAQVARSIIWSLCEVNCTDELYPTRVQLLHICCDILSQSLGQLSYDEVLRTAARLKGRILEKHPEYYHEQLMDATASYVIDNNIEFEKGLLIARVLSRLAHTHLGLVEYLCQQAVSSPTMLANARTNILFGFINCLANNNYTPDPQQWAEITRQITNNPILDAKNAALPWTKVCLELASLGYYDDRLLGRVFSKPFLDEFLSRPDNTLDYLQLLTLHEAVNAFHSKEYQLPELILEKARAMYPRNTLTPQLQDSVARGLGAREHAARDVLLPGGIVADVLMCLKQGYPVKLNVPRGKERVPIEELDLPPGALPVCIMNFNQGCFSMNSNRLRGTFRLILDVLEKRGFATVPVNTTEWLAAPPHERTPYLMREVGYKCGEMGMKLCAT